MNKNEYIIVNRTTLEKRIEELEKTSKELYYREGIDEYDFAKEELEGILAQSTPLIPIIEDAFDSGRKLSNKSQLYTPDFYWAKENYIQNLKLDI